MFPNLIALKRNRSLIKHLGQSRRFYCIPEKLIGLKELVMCTRKPLITVYPVENDLFCDVFCFELIELILYNKVCFQNKLYDVNTSQEDSYIRYEIALCSLYFCASNVFFYTVWYLHGLLFNNKFTKNLDFY